MRKSTLIWLLLFFLVLSGLYRLCRYYKGERDRLADNQRALLADVEFYRTNDSLSAASVERLTFSNREFEKYCRELKETITTLNLKIKRLQSVSQTATETEYQVKTQFRDSIVMLPGRIDTLRCVNYRSDYLTLSGCIEGSQFSGLIESRDTIVQIVHRVPRRFWFIRFGTKAIRQEVISKNPYSKITYTEYIELKR